MTPRFRTLLGAACLAALLPTAVRAQRAAPADSVRVAPVAAPADKPSFIPLAGLFYSPETKLGLAVFIAPVFRLGAPADTLTRKSTARVLAYYTQEKQWSVQFQHTLFTPGERYVISGDARFYDYPIFYYGIGDDTRKEDEGLTQYKLVTVNQRLLRRLSPRRRLFAGGQYLLAHLWDIDASASPKLRERPPGELVPNTVSGLGPVLLLDTRDRLTFPATGTYTELSAVFTGVGGDYSFRRYTADVRRYFSLNARGTQVLAVQGYVQLHDGYVPFRELAPLGGLSLLRGYYEGRYRDRQLLAGQVEYRRPLYRRFGAAFFFGAGEVGNTPAAFDRVKVAGGAGLRFQFNRRERLNARADYGIAQGGQRGFYFSIGEAF